MLLTYIYIYIYIDIVTDVPDTSGESKNNIGPPSGGPKTCGLPTALETRIAWKSALLTIIIFYSSGLKDPLLIKSGANE